MSPAISIKGPAGQREGKIVRTGEREGLWSRERGTGLVFEGITLGFISFH